MQLLPSSDEPFSCGVMTSCSCLSSSSTLFDHAASRKSVVCVVVHQIPHLFGCRLGSTVPQLYLMTVSADCCSDKEASYAPQFQLGQWEGHILASLPFYMLLLPLLLELIKSRVSSQATKALQDLAKVTQVQAHSPQFFRPFLSTGHAWFSSWWIRCLCVVGVHKSYELVGRHALVAESQQAAEIKHGRGQLRNL